MYFFDALTKRPRHLTVRVLIERSNSQYPSKTKHRHHSNKKGSDKSERETSKHRKSRYRCTVEVDAIFDVHCGL